MGASSTPQTVLLFVGALEAALVAHGYRVSPGAGTAAASSVLTESVPSL
jgi:aspartate aminotransferase-like enzyme